MDITELFGPNRTGINQTHDFFLLAESKKNDIV